MSDLIPKEREYEIGISDYDNYIMKCEVDTSDGFSSSSSELDQHLPETNFKKRTTFTNELDDFNSQKKGSSYELPDESKPSIPLLFIEEESMKSVCSECRKDLLPNDHRIVNCSNNCGEQIHKYCVPYSKISSSLGKSESDWNCHKCSHYLPDKKRVKQIPMELQSLQKNKNYKAGIENGQKRGCRKRHMPFSSEFKYFLNSCKLNSVDKEAKDSIDVFKEKTNAVNCDVKDDELKPVENKIKFQSLNTGGDENVNPGIKYVVCKNSTRNGKHKLYDSLGYSYTVRRVKPNLIIWQCIKCNGHSKCHAAINQVDGNVFIRNNTHSHSGLISEYEAAIEYESKFYDSLKPNSRSSIPNGHNLKSKAIKSNNELEISSPKVPVLGLKKKVRRKRSVYVEVKDEMAGNISSTILLDTVHGYSYRLQRTTERIKLYACSEKNTCKASVKEVGGYFIQSTQKHTHESKLKASSPQKEPETMKMITPKKKALRNTDNKEKSPKSVVACKEPLKSEIQEQREVNLLSGLEKVGRKSRNNTLKSCAKVSSNNASHKETLVRKKISNPETHPNESKSKFFSKKDEEKIVNFLLKIGGTGLLLTNKLILTSIKELIESKRVTNLSNEQLSRAWVSQFMELHPELSDKYVIKVQSYDFNVTVSSRIDNFFEDLKSLLRQNHRLDINNFLTKKNAHRIYNCDRMYLNLIPNTNGFRENSNAEPSDVMTVFCCIGADGSSTKPLIINKGNSLLNYETSLEYKKMFNTAYSTNGDLTSNVFYTWLSLHFNSYLSKNNIERPVFLLLNGTSCFFSTSSLQFAEKNNIILFHTPRNVARSFQPLSISLFYIIRKKYLKEFENWRKCRKKRLPEKCFPSVFMEAYNEVDISGISKNAFETVGLCPLRNGVKKYDSPSRYEAELNLKCSKLDHGNSVTKNYKSNNKRSVSNLNTLDNAEVSENNGNNISENNSLSHVKTCDESTTSAKSVSPNKILLKDAYRLALEDVDKLFHSVVDPSILDLYRQKLETSAEYPDTTFLVWRGLQQLKEVSAHISSPQI